jgi:hypothetical protein
METGERGKPFFLKKGFPLSPDPYPFSQKLFLEQFNFEKV